MAATVPTLEFMFSIRCLLEAPVPLGTFADGERRVVAIRGGEVRGEQIQGNVQPGGADWQVVRADGVTELEARYVIETEDGVRIQVRNRGLRHGPAEVLQRIAAGEPVARNEYYCSTAPVFTAPQGKYAWLNESVFVATAERLQMEIHLDVFRVP